jgi:hypothetical protein
MRCSSLSISTTRDLSLGEKSKWGAEAGEGREHFGRVAGRDAGGQAVQPLVLQRLDVPCGSQLWKVRQTDDPRWIMD